MTTAAAAAAAAAAASRACAETIMKVVVALALALSCAVTTLAFDGIPVWARGGKIASDLQAKHAHFTGAFGSDAGNTTANYFDQMIDHNNKSRGTFRQKYYVDFSSFSLSSPGPVFFYIGGEGPMGSSPGGFVTTLAQKYSGAIVSLEHRWYGESIPADITSTDDLETLSVEQALADAAAFVAFVTSTWLQQKELVWVSVGGSYPGALSAWFREQYPSVVDAAISSSGVVAATKNFVEFDMQVKEAIGSACAAQVQAVTSAFEHAWSDAALQKQLFKLFNTTPSRLTKADFAWMLADSAAMGDQYGYKAAMCAMLAPADAPPLAALAAFAKWTSSHYGDLANQCYYSTSCLSDVTQKEQWYNQKTWVWQCCSQLAYWQVAYAGSLRSSAITLDYFQNQCNAAFGRKMKQDTDAFNAKYGGFRPNATRVIALNGSDDPWRRTCVKKSLTPLYVENTATCDGCGHCGDLRGVSPSESPAITAQHAFVDSYVGAWIKAASEERGI